MVLTQKRPSGLLHALFRAPIWLYKANLGWLLGKRFLMLTHTGRTSGLPRQTVIEVVSHDAVTDTYYVAAAWRRKSDWYRNILKHPRVHVQVGNQKYDAQATQLAVNEAEQVLWDYAQKHPMVFRELGVVMLGERLSPTVESSQRLAKSVPVMALKPIN